MFVAVKLELVFTQKTTTEHTPKKRKISLYAFMLYAILVD